MLLWRTAHGVCLLLCGRHTECACYYDVWTTWRWTAIIRDSTCLMIRNAAIFLLMRSVFNG